MDAEKGGALHAARWASSGLSSLTWGSSSAHSLAAACAPSSQPRVAAPPPPPPPGVARRRDPGRAAEVSAGTGDGVRGGWAAVMMAGTGVGRKNYGDGGGDEHRRQAQKMAAPRARSTWSDRLSRERAVRKKGEAAIRWAPAGHASRAAWGGWGGRNPPGGIRSFS